MNRPLQRIPLGVKVPVLVAILMATVGTAISTVVLNRLERDQELYLEDLSMSLLDGISLAVAPHVVRRDVWETFDILDRAAGREGAVAPRWLVATLPDGTVLASSDPLIFGLGEMTGEPVHGVVIDERSETARLERDILEGDVAVGRIAAEIDIGPLLSVRRDVLATLIALNGGLSLLFAGIGFFIVRALLNPVARLTSHVGTAEDGRVRRIPDGPWPAELGLLVDRYNSMAQAVGERDELAARLADEEKVALLGRLASGMAHEVNNPLGGMMTALDTLKKHGRDDDVRTRSLELIERGLNGIRNVVRSALLAYKGSPEPGLLNPADLDDLRFLVAHETARRAVALQWTNRLAGPVAVDGGAVRQIVLNLLLNACAATPVGGVVRLDAAAEGDRLSILVRDEGSGMPREMADLLRGGGNAKIPPGGRGLGLWTVARLMHRVGGSVEVDATPGNGTRTSLSIPLRRPVLDAVA